MMLEAKYLNSIKSELTKIIQIEWTSIQTNVCKVLEIELIVVVSCCP